MANLSCTLCDAESGVLMVTMLEDGDTQIVGPQCMPGYALSMAAAATQGLPRESGDAFGELFDAVAANDPRPPKSPEHGSKSARKRSANTAQLEVEQSTGTKLPSPPGEPGTPQTSGSGETATTTPVLLETPCSTCGGVAATGDDTKVTCDGCGTVLATREQQGE